MISSCHPSISIFLGSASVLPWVEVEIRYVAGANVAKDARYTSTFFTATGGEDQLVCCLLLLSFVGDTISLHVASFLSGTREEVGDSTFWKSSSLTYLVETLGSLLLLLLR